MSKLNKEEQCISEASTASSDERASAPKAYRTRRTKRGGKKAKVKSNFVPKDALIGFANITFHSLKAALCILQFLSEFKFDSLGVAETHDELINRSFTKHFSSFDLIGGPAEPSNKSLKGTFGGMLGLVQKHLA